MNTLVIEPISKIVCSSTIVVPPACRVPALMNSVDPSSCSTPTTIPGVNPASTRSSRIVCMSGGSAFAPVATNASTTVIVRLSIRVPRTAFAESPVLPRPFVSWLFICPLFSFSQVSVRDSVVLDNEREVSEVSRGFLRREALDTHQFGLWMEDFSACLGGCSVLELERHATGPRDQ